ncbi:MAG: YqhG family protein [Bacilli bacterium]
MFEDEHSLFDYCERYFRRVDALRKPAPSGVLCVELPRDVDKELTDRPFYWMWVEAMNETPANTVLYLKFNPDSADTEAPPGSKPELVVPGCYRMLRLYASAKARGAFAAAYETGGVLFPYAVFVVKVSFVSDRRMDFLESYAIDLQTFQVYSDVIHGLLSRTLLDERPQHARLMATPIDMDKVFALLLHCVRLDVEARDHQWAMDARRRLELELSRLDDYYASLQGQTRVIDAQHIQSHAAERELRKAEIVWRTEPKVEVRPLQMALVYLAAPPERDAAGALAEAKRPTP